MSHPDRPTWLEINLSAITSNISAVCNYVKPSTQVLAVVKANAYGHGSQAIAKAALKGGASALGVALLQEGIALRNADIQAPIVILGPSLPHQADRIVAHNLSQTVSDLKLLEALEKAAQHHNKQTPVHLKIDTGMGRVGISPNDVLSLAQKITDSPHLIFEGIATHIAWERAEDMHLANQQIDLFTSCLSKLPTTSVKWRHAANSVMTVHMHQSHFDLVRVGLLTYGIPPAQGTKNLSLTPALSLKSHITQIRDLDIGQRLSYGGTYTLTEPARIALIPIGYADGYSRRLSNKAHVLIGGCPCPVVGSVCMDLTLVDITQVPQAQIGDEVILLGQQGNHQITVTDHANWAGNITHEIVSQFGARLPRVYIP